MLTQTAQDMLHSQTISEAAVLRNLLAVLSQPESVVSPREGQWVVRRLAELSDWPWPMGLDSENPVL